MALTGQVAVVTGAARGIGKGIALGLAEAGAHVVVSDLGGSTRQWSYRLADRDELAQAAKEVEAIGGKALAVPCDVTRPVRWSSWSTSPSASSGVSTSW